MHNDFLRKQSEDKIEELMTKNLVLSESISCMHQDGAIYVYDWIRYALGIGP